MGEHEPAVNTENNPTKIPKVMGILLIVLGSLYTLFGIFGGLWSIFAGTIFDNTFSQMPVGKGADSQFMAVIQQSVEAMRPITIINGIQSIAAGLISIAAIFSGAGLVQYKKWGIKTARIWAILALASIVVSIIVYFTILQPMTERYINSFVEMFKNIPKIPDSPDPAMFTPIMRNYMGSMGIVSIIIRSFFAAIFPVLTLIFMSFKNVYEACGE